MSEVKKAIWFPPSFDGKWKNPAVVYLSEIGFSNKQYVAICNQYFGKDGEDRGLRDVLEGRYSHARRKDLQPYSELLWNACQKLIDDRKRNDEELKKRLSNLKKGKVQLL